MNITQLKQSKSSWLTVITHTYVHTHRSSYLRSLQIATCANTHKHTQTHTDTHAVGENIEERKNSRLNDHTFIPHAWREVGV